MPSSTKSIGAGGRRPGDRDRDRVDHEFVRAMPLLPSNMRQGRSIAAYERLVAHRHDLAVEVRMHFLRQGTPPLWPYDGRLDPAGRQACRGTVGRSCLGP